jgi:hypothetical protein
VEERTRLSWSYNGLPTRDKLWCRQWRLTHCCRIGTGESSPSGKISQSLLFRLSRLETSQFFWTGLITILMSIYDPGEIGIVTLILQSSCTWPLKILLSACLCPSSLHCTDIAVILRREANFTCHSPHASFHTSRTDSRRPNSRLRVAAIVFRT